MKLKLIFILSGVLLTILPWSGLAQEVLSIPKHNFTLNAGYGFSLKSLSPWGNGYRNEMKDGFSANMQYVRLYKDGIGFGVNYSIHRESAAYPLEDGVTKVKDNVFLNYVAPMLVTRWTVGSKWLFGLNFGIGYVNYHDNGKRDGIKCVTNGNSFGANIDVTSEYRITRHFGIGVDIGINGAYFKKLHRTVGGMKETIKLSKSDKINASHLDLMAGIRYHF